MAMRGAGGIAMKRAVTKILGMSILLVALGTAITAVRRLGLLNGGECSPTCPCSVGDAACTCGHPTCLSPAA